MWKLTTAILIVAATVGFRPAPSPETPAAPTLKVSVGPHRGVIPAKFANGRPVYLFQAQVSTTTEEEPELVVLRDEVLLQAGMSGKLHAKYEQFELLGAISIDRNGTARYRVSIAEGGRIVSSSEAHVVPGYRQGSRG